MKKPLLGTLLGIALVAAGIALAASLLVPYAGELAGSDYSRFIQDGAENTGVDQESTEFPTIDWEALRETNPDIVGWIHVEGTPIDYPVVQARANDPQRYLNCALDGSWSGHGCPYVDADCDGVRARNVLTYGHNMIDGSMYSAFAGFTDQGYFDGHREILFLTPTHNYKLEAVAAREVSADYHHPRIDFENDDDLAAYLVSEAGQSQAVGRVPVKVKQIFEFVCCSYGASNGRTIVYAVEPAGRSTSYN